MSCKDERYEDDPRLSREVVRVYREAWGQNGYDASLALVHYRGRKEELEIGLEYCRSSDPVDRVVGAEVLAQLGWSDCSFREEAVAVLIGLLSDTDERVIHSAATGLGHRDAPSSIPHLVRLAGHKSSEVRFGVVFGLCGQSDSAAIECLTRLAADCDVRVRSWAVFALGSQTEADTPELREALFQALNDDDLEVRGEALVGLASRHDARTKEALLSEWRKDEISALSLEAARELGDPSLLPNLEEIHKLFGDQGDDYFQKNLRDALETLQVDAQKDGIYGNTE